MSGLLGDIGTIEWSRKTQGILGGSERVRYTAAVLLQTARMAPRLLLARAGAWNGSVDPSRFAPPDTALTRRALEACADLDPMLLQHGLRAYCYARGCARRRGGRAPGSWIETAYSACATRTRVTTSRSAV